MNRAVAWRRRLRRFLPRLAADTRGIAAVEFAIIVPLMLLMFFGMIDVSQGIAAKRKVTIIAQSMADLASRYTKVTDTDLANFDKIGEAILTPYAASALTVRISQVYVDPTTGAGKIYWSKGDAPLPVNTAITVPTGLIGKDSSNKVLPNQYLIFAEVTYGYTPIIGYVVGKGVITLKESTYTRPRQSACVFYSSTNDCT